MPDQFMLMTIGAGFLFLVLDREWIERRTPPPPEPTEEELELHLPPDRPPSPIFRPWRMGAGVALGAATAVDHLKIDFPRADSVMRPIKVTVEGGGTVREGWLDGSGRFDFAELTASSLRLTFERPEGQALEIGTVELPGVPAVDPLPEADASTTCGLGPTLRVNGQRVETRISDGTLADQLTGRPLRYETCTALELVEGYQPPEPIGLFLPGPSGKASLAYALRDLYAKGQATEHDMMVATELGNYLVQTPDGSRYIRRMIKDDIKAAEARGDLAHSLALKLILHHYICSHPECAGAARSMPTHVQRAVRRIIERMPPRCA